VQSLFAGTFFNWFACGIFLFSYAAKIKGTSYQYFLNKNCFDPEHNEF